MDLWSQNYRARSFEQLSVANESEPLPSFLSHLRIRAIEAEPPRLVFRGRSAAEVTAVLAGGRVICGVVMLRWSTSSVAEAGRDGNPRTEQQRRDGSDPVADERSRSPKALPLQLSHRTSVAWPRLRSNGTGQQSAHGLWKTSTTALARTNSTVPISRSRTGESLPARALVAVKETLCPVRGSHPKVARCDAGGGRRKRRVVLRKLRPALRSIGWPVSILP
jgi:hypothetical protein